MESNPQGAALQLAPCHCPHACVKLPVPKLKNAGRGYLLVVEVVVRDNNVDQALRVLKKKMQREGIYREMKMRKHYEKPSEKRVREAGEAVRRARKLARKKSDMFD